MDTRKIYRYYPVTTEEEVWHSIEWAQENFERYNGEVSFLWNDFVLFEFARLNNEVAKWKEAWGKMWADVFNQYSFDYETAEEIDAAPAEVVFRDDEGIEEEIISSGQRNLYMLSYL